MKKLFRIIFIILIFIFFGCSSKSYRKVTINEAKFEEYISVFFIGELGTLPIGCEISNVKWNGYSVIVCGKVFDKYSGETFNIDIWVGSIVEKTNPNGINDLVPFKRKSLFTTGNDGIFCVTFEIRENDILFMDQVGYDPAIFEVYNFLQDSTLLK